MQPTNYIEEEFGFPIRRRSAFYHAPDSKDPDSWFEKNKFAALNLIILASDDLRMHRTLAAQQLSEAWSDEFLINEGSRGADSVDQLMHIIWLQHWSTLLGLLSSVDLDTIRYLSERGERQEVLRYFNSLNTKRYQVVPNHILSEVTREVSKEKRVIGMFHGSFDPPHWVHLSIANYYRQFCDLLIVGVDSDDLLRLRKGEGHPRFEFQRRYDILSSFPNAIDLVAQVPTEIIRNRQYDSQEIVKFYQSFGVGIVFFDGNEPHRDWRIEQITKAGAQPFDISPYKEKVFSSTELMRMRSGGNIPIISEG